MKSRAPIAFLVAVAAALSAPAFAWAHATLESSSPERGANLPEAPEAIELHFSEPVEGSFGSLRVFASTGEQLDGLETFRPGGEGSDLGMRPPADLDDGTYTVTYRVISADSHPVSGGFVFSVGDSGAAPSESVSELLEDTVAGSATKAAAMVARFLSYAATALVVGVLAFALLVFGPAARRVGQRGEVWNSAESAFEARSRSLVKGGAVIGLAGGAVGIVSQGAIAGGTSAWSAIDPSVVGDVLSTRFGTVWGLRELAWLVVLVATFLPLPYSRGSLLALALPLSFVLAAPSLSGHASTYTPEALLLPANVAHVAAMSVWVGGIAALAIGVRSATRKLEPTGRSRLLAETMSRFSPFALGSVVVLAATGTIQAITYLESLSDLWDTGFGRAVGAKIILLGALIAIGAVHRRRSLPLLREAAAGDSAPDRGGKIAMRSLRSELALFAAVLTATAILVGEPPPGRAAEGPQSATTLTGDVQLDVTVDPALAGSNEIHLYLFDARDGSQYDVPKGVELHASLPEEDVGPIVVDIEKSGPGHYTAPDAPLGIPGTWELELSGRISRFEDLTGSVEVEVR